MSTNAPQLTRNAVSADRPVAVVEEQEGNGLGGLVDVKTIFLTASECPVGCNMCDLWKNTLPTATPPGAIPRQIESAFREPSNSAVQWIKLYNSGNFFDSRSIPPSDYAAIAELCSTFDRVIVENHPRFGRQRLLHFRDSLAGQLEVAVGLETVQPRWLGRLGKQMSRDGFDQYAAWLQQQGVDLRVFLIVGVPGISVCEAIRWARLSVRHVCRIGARHISLIPARAGHGWNGRADQLPSWSIAELAALQQLALQDVNGDAVVTVDTWDIAAGADQINRVNLTQCVDV